MLKAFFIYCILFLLSLGLMAQTKTPQQKLDSLLLVNKNYHKEDSTKFIILRNIMLQYMRMKNPPMIEQSANAAMAFAAKANKPNWQGVIYYRIGLNYHGLNNYLKAEENYYKSIEKYNLVKDLDWVAGIYSNLGALYTEIPDYTKALDVNQKAIAIYQKLKDDEGASNCYTNIGILYNEIGQQSKAVDYLNRSLKVYLKEGENTRGVAVVYEGLGNAYLSASYAELQKMNINPEQKHKVALSYFNKALKVAEIINDNGLSGSLNNAIGEIYEQLGNKTDALKSYEKSVEIFKKEERDVAYGQSLLDLGKFYYNNGNYPKALVLLKEALTIGEELKNLNLLSNANQNLSLTYEKLNDFNQSLANFKQYIAVKDQIFDSEKEKEITRRRLQLDFTVKEKDYQIKQQLTDGALQRQVLLAKQRQQELVLSDQEKSLQRLTFLKKQADLENEKRLQQEMLAQEQLKAKLKDKEIGLQKTELRVNRNINVFLGILAAILFASALFVFYAQRRTAKLNRIVSEQKIELEKLGKVKDRIFSVVSHDMRTPVNSLISFIQLLEGGSISQEKLTKYAANLKNTLGYTSTMMENLLNWASSQMEGYKPVIEKFDVELCVKEVVNSLQITANQKQIAIENEVKSGILCAADMNMTSLVLRNLISNAIKFTPNHGAIKITAVPTTKHVLVNVIDNGIGLSASQLLRINQPGNLETGETTIGTNKEKGTGIGLALCKTFTNLMKGSLAASSKPNEGSVFTLKLPTTL